MTNDDIAFLRQLADWHDRQARYLLLTVPAGQHDRGRFNFTAAARLSRLADEATMSGLPRACRSGSARQGILAGPDTNGSELATSIRHLWAM